MIIIPVSARTEVNVHISIPLPPAIVFPMPPALIVIPETYIYAVPDIDEDIFFFNGWWWRPWNGRWYRSRNYNSGWVYYQSVPSFYLNIPSAWRDDYRNNRWKGHPWKHQRIQEQQLKSNWKGWEKGKHWERKDYWGTPGLRSRRESQGIHYPNRQLREDHVYRESERPQSRELRSQGKPGGGSSEKQHKKKRRLD